MRSAGRGAVTRSCAGYLSPPFSVDVSMRVGSSCAATARLRSASTETGCTSMQLSAGRGARSGGETLGTRSVPMGEEGSQAPQSPARTANAVAHRPGTLGAGRVQIIGGERMDLHYVLLLVIDDCFSCQWKRCRPSGSSPIVPRLTIGRRASGRLDTGQKNRWRMSRPTATVCLEDRLRVTGEAGSVADSAARYPCRTVRQQPGRRPS